MSKQKKTNGQKQKHPGHIVTVLLQDYFHRGVFKPVIGEKQWSRFESRLDRNVEDALDLFQKYNIKATFFALGWIADQYPGLIKKIASEGHEIANAGYWARSVGDMTHAQFKEDIERAKNALEAAGSNKILGYRCAYKWLKAKDLWILEVLAAEGYVYDASLRPPSYRFMRQRIRRFKHEIQTKNATIWEFPASTVSLLGFNFAIAGGNYLRQLPHSLMLRGFKRWCKQTDNPYIIYFHPWELDTQIPVITAVGAFSKIRQYRNLGKMELILPEYFNEGRFQSISQYLNISLEYPSKQYASSIDKTAVPGLYAKGKPASYLAHSQKEVSIVIPCFNEASSIPYLARALDEMAAQAKETYSLKFIFVDDFSTDDTYSTLSKVFGARENCKIIRHKHNRGVASAIKTGLIAADTEIVGSIDADCSYDPIELLKMIPFIEDGADMVTASPYHPAGFVVGVPWWRLFLSRSLSRIYHVILRHKLSTYTSCFRAYRRGSVVNLNTRYGDYRGIVEMLAKLDIGQGVIKEYPTTLQCRIFGQSKMKVFKTMASHLKLLLEIVKFYFQYGMILNRLYYNLKPLIPRSLQILLRRRIVARKYESHSHVWPINPSMGKLPDGWVGWPNDKQFALLLIHDVDTAKGQKRCSRLIEIEKALGFRSSFNFVPERYNVSNELRNHLVGHGFEVGVHGLKHDGKLYASKKIFQERAIKINYYLKEWKSVGFRSPSMHHNLEWLHELDIEYDASTFDTDPFEPQSDGVGTIVPFWVRGDSKKRGYVELPYTLPQDSTLFVIMQERGIEIWKQKLDWIAQEGGMALLNTHPDYMGFDGKKLSIEEYPVEYYEEFLNYVKRKYDGHYWHVLPKDMARFWATNVAKNDLSVHRQPYKTYRHA